MPPSAPSLITATKISTLSSSDQLEKKKTDQEGPEVPPLQLEDLWSNILVSHNQMMMINANSRIDGAAGSNSTLPPPTYVHPMVKRSSSSLSDKSLDICTESLGSETGSDGFSSYPPSEDPGDHDHHHHYHPVEAEEGLAISGDRNGLRVVSNFTSTCRKVRASPAKSFPPPLRSLAERHDGSRIRIRSCRHNGRLVVDAVSVPSLNFFRARRQDGRLLLTLATPTQSLDESDYHEDAGAAIDHDHQEAEKHVVSESIDGFTEEEEEEVEEREESQDQQQKIRGQNRKEANEQLVIKFPKLPKFYALTRTSRCHRRFNKAVITTITSTQQNQPGGQSALPPPWPTVAQLIPATPSSTAASAAVTLNAYECYWRTKPTPVVALLKQPPTHQAPQLGNSISIINDNNDTTTTKLIVAHGCCECKVESAGEGKHNQHKQQEELVTVKGKKRDYLVPLLRGCKEQRIRRSVILSWEPKCIATT